MGVFVKVETRSDIQLHDASNTLNVSNGQKPLDGDCAHIVHGGALSAEMSGALFMIDFWPKDRCRNRVETLAGK